MRTAILCVCRKEQKVNKYRMITKAVTTALQIIVEVRTKKIVKVLTKRVLILLETDNHMGHALDTKKTN